MYTGRGGGMYTGPEGGLYRGPGGGLYSGPDGGLFSGPGGGLYAGPCDHPYQSIQPPRDALIDYLANNGFERFAELLRRH
jgi:hypothetical protein